MKLKLRAAALITVSLIGLTALSCKGRQENANQQSAPAAEPKPGRWVAQYRSPASASYAGANLALFSYSGISVVSPSVVFVCGDVPKAKSGEQRVAVIVRTTDGGQNWIETLIDLPGFQIPTLNAIHFISADVGWAVGADFSGNGVVLKTTDGGLSWAAAKLPHKQVPTSVFFADADTGWIGGATPPPGEDEGAGGPSAILATSDGGATWHPQYNVPISIHRVFFIDRDTGWASGSRGRIYNTTDGGRTWDTQRTEIELTEGPVDLKDEAVKQFVVRGVQFTDKEHGFACAGAEDGGAGRVLATSNGGATWRRTWIVVGNRVQDVFFLNANEGWALVDGGQYVYRTVDSGRTWLSEPKVFEQDVPLLRLGAADAGHVWAVGGGAIFFRLKE